MESNQLNSPKVFSHKRQGEDTQKSAEPVKLTPKFEDLHKSKGNAITFQAEFTALLNYFKQNVSTIEMASEALEIPLQNTCEIVEILKKEDFIDEVFKDKISQKSYLSANKVLLKSLVKSERKVDL